VFFPKKLVHYLGGSHPVYCFQPTGEGCSFQTNQCIESMAERYVEDLIRYYPNVPYCLFGYSFGGFLAYEMARKLHDRNIKVALLAIIDTGPSLRRPRTKTEKLQYLVRIMNNLPRWMHDVLFHRDRKEFANRIRKKLRTAGRKINNIIAHNQGLSVQERLEDIFEWDQLSTHHQALMETHYQALDEYNPKPYPGRLTLFRAHTRPPLHSLKPDLGWGDLAVGGINIKHVPGNHLSILHEPNVKVLVESLRDCLEHLR
jgi:thioesterase domain-containing protein